MSKQQARTLVVDLAYLHQMRDELGDLGRLRPSASGIYASMRNVIDGIIREGTTVPLDHLTVVELATPVRETPWQRQERNQERYYSEADYADADLSPAGGAA